MKKVTCLLLALVMALSVIACAPNAPAETTAATTAPTQTTAPEATFMAGFGKADITPEEFGVPMQGYSNNAFRLSSGLYSYIYSIALAVRDEDGNTAIIISVDSAAMGRPICEEIHAAIEKETGVPAENIFITSIHQHSTPSPDTDGFQTSKNYWKLMVERVTESAADAVADLAPAEMYTTTVTTEGITFNKHYVMADGTFAGDNYGSYASGIVGTESEPDTDLQLVKFVREDKKDILFSNFQGHPHSGTHSGDTNLSADMPGVYRDEVEANSDYHVMYVSGAQGNLHMKSKIEEKNIYKDYKELGKALAKYALEAEDSYVQAQTGKVQATRVLFKGPVNHTTDYLKEEANAINEVFARTDNQTEAMKQSTSGKINSVYHARAILLRCTDAPTLDIYLMAVSFGDVAICGGPYEMFDTNGMEVKADSPFQVTFMANMVNGAYGYIPSQLSFDNGCYPADISRYLPGTGELCRDEYLKILNTQRDAQ